jgi:hypothetical protein
LINHDLSSNGNVSPQLREKILKYLEKLAKSDYISGDTHRDLRDLLDNNKFDEFVIALGEVINQAGEALEKNKSEELTILKTVHEKFGGIKESIEKEKENFRKAKDQASNDIEQDKLTRSPNIREFANRLPKEVERKPSKNRDYFMHIMTNALAAINHLEGIFRSLNSYTFNTQRHSFSGYGEFALVDPRDMDMVTSLPTGELYWQRLHTIAKLDNEFNGRIAVPYDGPSLGLTIGDSITRRTKIAEPETRDKIKTYINSNSNHFKIVSKTHDYATFLILARELKHNQQLFREAEYVASSIFSYLNELDGFRLMNFPDLLKRELKVQRNVSKHGNIYVDLVDAPLDEFLVRYASIFIKNIKPELENIYQRQNQLGGVVI